MSSSSLNSPEILRIKIKNTRVCAHDVYFRAFYKLKKNVAQWVKDQLLDIMENA